jgi:hypothetical protein
VSKCIPLWLTKPFAARALVLVALNSHKLGNPGSTIILVTNEPRVCNFDSPE